MEFETIETLPLECGSLLLQQEVPSARHQVYDPPRLERRVLFSDSRSTTRHLPDLSALRSLVCDMNIRLLQTTYGREATLAEIIVTLVDAIRTTETADDHRWAWVMEETYGIDLDDCVPRVDGTTLRFLGRKEDFRTYLLTFLPLIEVLVDLTTLQYSTQDMEVWRESARRGPQFRAGNVSFVRVQNRPHIGRPSSFPRSDVMCVENAQEHGVLDLTALPTLAKLSPNAFVHAIRDQQVAFAHIACALRHGSNRADSA
jgi:hypothetical protein